MCSRSPNFRPLITRKPQMCLPCCLCCVWSNSHCLSGVHFQVRVEGVVGPRAALPVSLHPSRAMWLFGSAAEQCSTSSRCRFIEEWRKQTAIFDLNDWPPPSAVADDVGLAHACGGPPAVSRAASGLRCPLGPFSSASRPPTASPLRALFAGATPLLMRGSVEGRDRTLL